MMSCNNTYIKKQILDFFQKKSTLSLEEIKELMNQDKRVASDEEIQKNLYSLLIDYGMIVKNDYFYDDPKYSLLDQYLWDSSYSSSYYNFCDDDNKREKTFILISDTHLGNSEIEDLQLLNNLYDYAISHNITRIFHLGDLFDRSVENDKKLELFLENYPICSPNELITYGLHGNHDANTKKYEYYRNKTQDLRTLSKYNSSFYMIPRKKWQTTLNDFKIHFSHKLYLNPLLSDYYIVNIEDLTKPRSQISKTLLNGDSNFDIQISGHLHEGFITIKQDSFHQESLFIGVPSTSKINQNKTVAYLVYLNHDNIRIVNLKANTNQKIATSSSFNVSYDRKHKTYKKVKLSTR